MKKQKRRSYIPHVILTGIAAFIAAFGAACSTDSAGTGQRSYAPMRAYEAGMNEDWVGRGRTVQYTQVRREPAPTPPPPARQPTPLPQPARTDGLICSDATGGLVPMSIVMPREAAFGTEFTYDINIAASQCVANVVVTDAIPEGATYVSSQPAGEQQGNRLRWNIGDMDKGQSATIKVTLRADREGNLVSCAAISADPRTCAQIFIGKPALALEKTGPETAVLGTTITYNITISNKGTMVAKDVVIVDELPEGLISTLDRRDARLEVGDLAPNESKTVSIAAKTLQKGRFCNVATATSSNAGTARAEACTVVVQAGVKIVKDGTKEQFLTRVARYNIVVSNIGDTPLTNVTVTDSAPAGTSIVEAPGATVSGNQAVWQIGNMAAGEEKTLNVSLTSTVAGNHCNSATVATAEGLRETAEACTLWSGLGAVLLQVVDDPDPIRVDEENVYTIRVTNQGTADLNNIRTVAEFDEPNSPTSASAGTVEGQKVNFPVVPKLGPKQSFSYTVRVKGVKPGDARNKVTIVSDEIPRPVVEEESSRVF